MSLTWPRERRITRRAEYTACYDGGERRYTKYFVVFARSSEDLGNGRLGLAVTKKCGNAVARNRIKRVLRAFFRLHQHEMPPMDIVVTPKSKIDLQPDTGVLSQLVADGIWALYAANWTSSELEKDRQINFVALGGKPSVNLTIQYTITEVGS